MGHLHPGVCNIWLDQPTQQCPWESCSARGALHDRLTVAVNLALYAPITQAGWNPARDFGPRVIACAAGWGKVAIPGPQNGFWVYVVGPCLGAPLGAALAEFGLWGVWCRPQSKNCA